MPTLLQAGPKPFPHFVLADFYEPVFAERLSGWLIGGASWRRAVHCFYDQFELDFRDAPPPDGIASSLLRPSALEQTTALAEQLFGTSFRPYVSVGAHKLEKGQGIGIHRDTAPGAESHRIVVQLSPGWRQEQGGELVFFDSQDIEDVRIVFRHVFNTAIAFPLGGASYHAVTEVSQGPRLTVIYGLWSASADFDSAATAGRAFRIRQDPMRSPASSAGT